MRVAVGNQGLFQDGQTSDQGIDNESQGLSFDEPASPSFTNSPIGSMFGESQKVANIATMSIPSQETVTYAGSGLVFTNTYDSSVTTQYRSAIIAAENFFQSHFTN